MTREEFDPLFLANRDCVANYYHNRYRHDISADLLQETYTRALEHCKSFDPSICKINTWLISILKNAILNENKYLYYHPSQTEKAYIPDGECHLYITHDYDIIYRELCKLPFRQRRVVVSLLQGLKTREMGRCFPKRKLNSYKQGVKYMRDDIWKCLILAEAV